MSAQTRRIRTRRLPDIGRGFAALSGVVLLIVGVPIALISWVGWPLPAEVPTVKQVTDALQDAYVPDEFLIKTLALICWLVWIELVASLIIEAIAYARGRTAGRVPLASIGVQRAAARLVATSALLGALLATRGMPEVANRALRPPESVTLVVDQEHEQSPAAEQPSDPDPTSLPVYEVQRRDTLWGIAESHLGDPFRWPEIYELNRGAPQPDGRTLRDPDLICPGWVLRLPVDATVLGSPPPPEPAETPPVEPEPTVIPIDTDGSSGDGMILVDDAIVDPTSETEVVTNEPAATPPAEVSVGTGAKEAEAPTPAAEAAVAESLAPASPASPAAVAGEVTVQPGDNFWVLAETQLANAWGRPPTDAEIVGYWQSLMDGNRQQLLPPGDPNLIYPGQVFTTPSPPPDPTVAQGAPPAAPSEPPPVTEAPTAPPDAEARPDSPEVPADTDGEADAGADDESGTEVVPEPGSDQEAETTEPPADTDGEVVPPTAPDLPVTEEASSPQESDEASRLPVGLIGGGVALAGVVLLLERRRRAQQRHRGRGRMVEMPPPPLQHEERVLREGAEVDRARLLDLAVRAAAAGSGATGLPALRWVEARADSVLLVLAAPVPPPPGFTAVDADRWVTHALVDELATIAGRTEMPAPTLIPVGTTSDGAELLIELESSGVVSVAGPPQEALEVLRAMAVAAATSPWSEQSEVVLVGMQGELLDLPWVSALPQLSEALVKVEAHVDRATSALRSLRCPSTSQARAAGIRPEACEPLLVVSAIQPSDLGERQRLVALAARPRSAAAVVTPAGGAASPPGLVLTVGEHGWLRIDGVDAEVWPHRLADEDAGVLMELLDVAAQREGVAPGEQPGEIDVRRPPPPPAPPEPPATEVQGASTPVGQPTGLPPEPIVVSVPEVPAGEAAPVRRLAALMTGVDVVVRVLGEVEAVRLTPSSPEWPEERLMPTRQKGLEAIAYLALRESSVDREDLEINLFPDGANAAKTVYNTVSAARLLVGEDLFPPTQGGRYELSDRVVTDYGLFCELVAQADEIDDAEVAAGLLTEALGLVRGEPFTGVGRGYSWVGPHRGMIVAQVVDAAEELAEVRLAMGDWRAVEWAARRGLRAFPSDERMYRLLMRAARAAGNVPGVQRVFRELCAVIADPDLGVEPEDTLHPETVALLEELTGVLPRDDRLGA